jgi:hypothetical protein
MTQPHKIRKAGRIGKTLGVDEHDRWFQSKVDEALEQDRKGTATWHEHAAVWHEVRNAVTSMMARQTTAEKRNPRRTRG